jgi:fermentation-respiration switch protein FrsA (DUF1100 family)
MRESWIKRGYNAYSDPWTMHRRRTLKILLAVLIELPILTLLGLGIVSYDLAGSLFTSRPLAERQPITQERVSADCDGCLRPVSLTAADGVHIQAYAAPSSNGAAVILLHGYRSDHTEMLPIAQILVRHGFGVILPEFRGHGGSQGEQITFGRLETLDIDAAFQYLLLQKDVDPHRIGLFGNSMGAGIAILYTAQNPAIRAVVAQSPYTTVKDIHWIKPDHATGFPSAFLVPLIQFWVDRRLAAFPASLDPIAVIGQISPRPVLILMGGQDTQVSPQGGQLLYDAALSPKTLWYEPALGHVAFPASLPEQFETRPVQFFTASLN